MQPRFIAAVLLALAVASNAAAQRIDIAAIVGDEIISTNDVAERRDLLMATNNVPPTIENQKRITPRVIESLIDENIQMQEAKRLSIIISDKDIQAALHTLEESRRLPEGTLLKSLKAQGLSESSLKEQITAQLAWTKVVQRKLRREVTISEDEVARAQQAAAADPGVPQINIAAISVLVLKPGDDAAAGAFAQEIADKLKAGMPMNEMLMKLQGRSDVRLSPPGWVDEEKLQPAMQQALRTMQPGEVTPPLKSMNTFQIIQVLQRRVAKKIPETTEMVIKEMVLPTPAKADEKSMLALRDAVNALGNNPGDCMSESVGAPGSAAKVKFSRVTYGSLPPELKPIVADLGVTQVSQPLTSPQAVRLFMLCERIDPGMGNLPPAAEVRRKLFNEKIELEAEKHLRNLKRDTFIEVKGAPLPDSSIVPQERKPVEEQKPKAKAKKNG